MRNEKCKMRNEKPKSLVWGSESFHFTFFILHFTFLKCSGDGDAAGTDDLAHAVVLRLEAVFVQQLL